MKLILTCLFSWMLVVGYSCTTFVIQRGEELVFGRNLDWYSDNGLVVINQRNQSKQSIVFSPDKPVSWVSKYGSITFNQFGKEFPFGGMNEQGLVIEIMVAKAQYPTTDERGAVNELQWIQYQLDNASSIDEVIQNDKIIRLRKISQDLHFLIADATGAVAVLEFVQGELKVYRGADLPFAVLENDVYAKSLANYEQGKACRFTKAAKYVQNYDPQKQSNIVDYSFKVLDDVALDGSWSIVYDIAQRRIHFKTASNTARKSISMDHFDYACSENTLCWDLQRKESGSIDNLFTALTPTLNTSKLSDALIKGRIGLPDAVKESFYAYHKTIQCAE